MDEGTQTVAFELRRRIDDLVYRFAKATDPMGRVGFKRSDGDYWIIWHEKLRWIAGAWDDAEVLGRPWDQLAKQSDASPPEGVWVSRKGSKSYVYDLVYVETP
ncbi:hypothetical protein [Pacificibacter sp. AS14]|uniref:hypothetical protein n=1 Tax=Pacificibacter sp. AS14 TaxID=3135785 RepID=UPI00317B0BB8